MSDKQDRSDEPAGNAEDWKNEVEDLALRGELWQLNDIQWWLDEATAYLCDEAKALVHEEVYAHYQDAVDDALHAGKPQREAHVHALAMLGHPDRANKRYRKTYVTVFEVEMLKTDGYTLSWKRLLDFRYSFVLLLFFVWLIVMIGFEPMAMVIIALLLQMLSFSAPTNLLAWALSIKGYLACLKFDLAVKSGMQIAGIAIVLVAPWHELSLLVILNGLIQLIAGMGSFLSFRKKIRNTFHPQASSAT